MSPTLLLAWCAILAYILLQSTIYGLSVTSSGQKNFAGFVHLPDNPRTYFRNIGTTAVTTEFAHLGFRFDLLRIQRALRALHQAIETAHSEAYSSENRMEISLLRSKSKILGHRMIRLEEASVPTPFASRSKRAICGGVCVAIIAGIAGLVTVGSSLYTLYEISNLSGAVMSTTSALQEEILRLEKLVSSAATLDDIVISAINITKTDIKHSTKMFWLSTTLAMATSELEFAERAIQSAATGHLDISIITANKNLKNNLLEVAAKASSKGLSLVTKNVHDLLHLPADITTTPTGIEIFVHIPMIQPQSIMKVYEHIHLPVPIPNADTTSIFILFNSDADTIAISKDKQTFRVTSASELNTDCVKIGNFFACPRGNMARRVPVDSSLTTTHDPGLCLWALLNSVNAAILATCKTSLVQPGPKVIQLTARTFITYGEATGNISCRTGNFQTSFHTTRYGSFHLPPGCTATSDTFELHSSDTAFIRSESDWAESVHLPANISHLTSDVDLPAIEKLMHQAANLHQNITHISLVEAQALIDRAKSSLSSGFFSLLSTNGLSLSIATIALILSLAQLIYTCCTHGSPGAAGAAQSSNLNVVIPQSSSTAPTAPHLYPAPPSGTPEPALQLHNMPNRQLPLQPL